MREVFAIIDPLKNPGLCVYAEGKKPLEIRNKTALVTGSAIRVGRTIALELARRGANVVVHYNRSKEPAEKTVNEIRALGVRSIALKAELQHVGEIRHMVDGALKEFGSVEILVNSASIFPRTPLAKISEADWDSILDSNLKGSFFCAQFVGEQMRARQQGKIINIADWAGIRPYAHYLPYCVSKAGVIALTKALAKELAPHVQVNCILPGPVLMPEDFAEEEIQKIINATPLKRIGTPADVAAAVVFLIEGSDFITGAMLPVDGGRLIA